MSALAPRVPLVLLLALVVLTPLLNPPGTSQAADHAPEVTDAPPPLTAAFASGAPGPAATVAASPRSAGFIDVAADSVHAPSIGALVEAGVTQGCSSDGTRFCPADEVTRAQMASFLARALRLAPPAQPLAFADVLTDNVHHDAIQALAAADITLGCAPGRFCPGDPVRRDQMASFLQRGLALTDPAQPLGFADVSTSNVHHDAIQALATADITLGCAPGRFCPGDPVRRDQMASFLQRGLTGDPSDVPLPPPPGPPPAPPEGPPPGLPEDGEPDPWEDPTGSEPERPDGLPDHGLPDPFDPDADDAAEDPLEDPTGSEPEVPPDLPPGLPPELPPDLPEGPPQGWDPEDVPDGGLPDPFDPDTGDLSDNPAEDPSGFDPDALPEIEGGEADPEDPVLIGEPEELPPPIPPEDDPDVFPILVERDHALALPRLGSPVQAAIAPRGAGWLPYRNLPIQVGALHTWDASGQPLGSCSATVVARDLILTAAHCVLSGRSWAQSYRFWPDLHGNQARYGAWEGYNSAFLPPYYVQHQPAQTAMLADVALIRLRPNAQGRHVGDVVGTLPVLYNAASVTLPKYSIGYPVEGWFAGTNQFHGPAFPYFCFDDDRGRFQHGAGWTSMAWGCYLNGGKSGGPVLASWNGRWHVSSVVSTGGRLETCSASRIDDSRCASRRSVWFMRNAYGPNLSPSPAQLGGLWQRATGR